MKTLLCLVLTLFLAVPASMAAPCSPEEERIHRSLFPGTECWHPDIHPLPHGISYPKRGKLDDKYVYVLNGTRTTVAAGVIDYAPDGDGAGSPDETSGFSAFAQLKPAGYVWHDLRSLASSNLVCMVNGREVRFDMRSFTNRKATKGPVQYLFLLVEDKGGKARIRSIRENEAISLMKEMVQTN